MEAKKAFIKDLKSDEDFLVYKEKCHIGGYHTIVATNNTYVLNRVGLQSQSILSLFRKGVI